MSKQEESKKEIPTTSLRNFYVILHIFSIKTRRLISDDFLRGKKYLELVSMVNSSNQHFEKYKNIEESFHEKNNNRKSLLSVPVMEISNTNEMVKIFESKKKMPVENAEDYSFKYIEREISPLRTTGAIFDDGKSGSKSGQGGLDFIAWNTKNNIPILGEIKVRDDMDPFSAMIQLLTYFSELSTKNQLLRLENDKLFEEYSISSISQDFYLYIVLSDYNRTNNDDAKKLLENAIQLSQLITGEIKGIKEIAFLRMDKPSGPILKI